MSEESTPNEPESNPGSEAAKRLSEVTKAEREKLGQALSAAREGLGTQFTSSGQEVKDALDNYVRTCPWKSIGYAAGAGFLLGLILRFPCCRR
ncbi:MAG: hypothetical protein AAGK14_09000 [Verrucomicrobiota bacterium]